MTDAQPALFPHADPTPCPVGHCQAIRLSPDHPVLTCRHDLNPPDDRPYKRPRGCLNTHDPTTTPFPEGF